MGGTLGRAGLARSDRLISGGTFIGSVSFVVLMQLLYFNEE